MNLLPAFKIYLQSKNYSISTVRNYIADMGKYYTDFHTLDVTSLITFLTKHSASPNYPRLLASLRLFCQFALDQNYVTTNPLKTALTAVNQSPKLNLKQLISQYSAYLSSHQASQSTIKNYINDINQYISWLNIET